VPVEHRPQVQVGQDVAVQDERRAVAEQRRGVPDGPGRPEGHRVHDVLDADAEPAAVAEVVPQRARAVAAAEHDPPHVVAGEVVDLVLDEGPVHQRDHRLGAGVRERAQARALPADQDDGVGRRPGGPARRAHAITLPMPS
jgi:hypothetical protein